MYREENVLSLAKTLSVPRIGVLDRLGSAVAASTFPASLNETTLSKYEEEAGFHAHTRHGAIRVGPRASQGREGVGGREPGASSAARGLQARNKEAQTAKDTPDLLGLALKTLGRLAVVARCCATRHRGGMAPAGLQALLELEIQTAKDGPPKDRS